MSEHRHTDRSPAARPFFAAAACLLLAGLYVATLPGCGGCGCSKAKKTAAELKKEKEEEERRKKEEEERKKPDFEISALMARPRSGLPTDEQIRMGAPYKPGHWTPTTLAAKTNHFDFVGELELVLTDRGGKPLPLLGMPYQLSTSRPMALTKRVPKAFEAVVYVPPQERQAWTACRLYTQRGRRLTWEVQQPLRSMPSYQYHFVVLAREPERYTYLSSLAAVNPPSDELQRPVQPLPYYRLAFLSTAHRPVLPTHATLWTSIAAVLWDDAQAEKLDRAQRQALLDWLHWGGHVVISGPASLDGLTGTFLAPYLPATADGGREVDGDDLGVLADWSSTQKTKATPFVEPSKPLSGVRLKLCAGSRFLPAAGELLAERRVGRGRIVVSAFPLTGRAVTSWPGWDEFVNGFLLRRPAREYVKHVERDLATNDLIEPANAKVQLDWADGTERLDADRITGVRYFVRDTGVPRASYGADIASGQMGAYGFEESPPGPGRAAWNDFNPVAEKARAALLEAARIEIPKRDFVVWVIAGYLVVLVPVNWLVFRLLGRVEWAWVAAPVIAVACTALVIHLARLDIGFARARTEVAVLEIQGDYPRGYLTRYNALYTSLSESYNFAFDDPGALIQPLPEPKVTSPEQFELKYGEWYRRLRCERGEAVRMAGFGVSSNDRGFVHSEEIVELAGGLAVGGDSAGGFQLTNRTGLELKAAGVLWRDPLGTLYGTWLDRVAADPDEPVPLRFVPVDDPPEGSTVPWRTEREGSALAPTRIRGELNLASLIELAQEAKSLDVGDMLLTAALDEPLPGMSVDPSSRQTRHAALVVAHLAYGFGPDPQPDVNTEKTPRAVEVNLGGSQFRW